MPTPKRAERTNRWGDSRRFYEVPGGNLYPSVTTILGVIAKPALVNWAAKVEREMVVKVSGELYQDAPASTKMSPAAWTTTIGLRLGKEKAAAKELAKASEIGSQVHALIEWSLKASLYREVGHPPKIGDKAAWAFACWEKWKKSVNLKPIFVEQTVWSDTHRYAGTLDLLAEVEGKLTVLDWKSGRRIYAEAYLQNAAYRHAIREMGHGDPVQGMIVRLPKIESDPDFEVAVAPDERACMEVFLNAQQLWNWQQEIEAANEAAREIAMPAQRVVA